MTWDKGWNFRATSTYVTDGTNETYSLGEAYPTTRNGVTFGWTSDLSANARDRDNTLDRRIAGLDFQANSGTQDVFRIDVPASGSYTVRLASGDSGSDTNQPYIQIRDGASALVTIDHTSAVVINHNYLDATDTTYTNVTWPGSNTPVTVSLSGTVLNFALGKPTAGTNNSMLAHIFVSQLSSGISTMLPALGRTSSYMGSRMGMP